MRSARSLSSWQLRERNSFLVVSSSDGTNRQYCGWTACDRLPKKNVFVHISDGLSAGFWGWIFTLGFIAWPWRWRTGTKRESWYSQVVSLMWYILVASWFFSECRRRISGGISRQANVVRSSCQFWCFDSNLYHQKSNTINIQENLTESQKLLFAWQKSRVMLSQQDEKPQTPCWHDSNGSLGWPRRGVWCSRLARRASPGASHWKICLSLHPTQRECVFAQPPLDRAQAGLLRPVQRQTTPSQQKEAPEEQSRPRGPLDHLPWGEPYFVLITGGSAGGWQPRSESLWCVSVSVCFTAWVFSRLDMIQPIPQWTCLQKSPFLYACRYQGRRLKK